MAFMDYILWAMVALMFVFLLRMIKGPSRWDRLLGLNLLSSKIMVIIIILSYLDDTGYLLDLAIIYALFGFIGEIFIALFLSDRSKDEKKEVK